jgi:hypothetical protein
MISYVRRRGDEWLTNHIDVVARYADCHIDDTVNPDSWRFGEFKGLDPGKV